MAVWGGNYFHYFFCCVHATLSTPACIHLPSEPEEDAQKDGGDGGDGGDGARRWKLNIKKLLNTEADTPNVQVWLFTFC